MNHRHGEMAPSVRHQRARERRHPLASLKDGFVWITLQSVLWEGETRVELLKLLATNLPFTRFRHHRPVTGKVNVGRAKAGVSDHATEAPSEVLATLRPA